DAEEQGEPEHASTSTTDHPGQEAPAPRAATGTVPSAETVAEPEPEESSAPSEFIDWVPGVGRTAPEIAQTAARRGSAPRPAESAYPQVHMAERPPAPNTGSRPAPVRPATPNGQAGPLPQHGAPMMSGAAGQHVGCSAQAPSAPPQPHRPMDPGAAGAQVGYPGPHGAHPPHSGGPPHGAPPLSPHHGQRPAPSTAGPGTPGALALPGLVCGNGHANSPERAVCRVCHAPLQGPTRTVARPPLGTIWTSYGERVVLDRTAILGRRPRASRVSAQDVPQLITVPSPQQDISRSHLELRLEGWHVVAIDLGTTNGTTLHRAGFDPARLRAREGVVLRDGDALDLGDGVHLRYGEKARARARPLRRPGCPDTSTSSCWAPAVSPMCSSTGSSARSGGWRSRCCCRTCSTSRCGGCSTPRPTSWPRCRPIPRSSRSIRRRSPTITARTSSWSTARAPTTGSASARSGSPSRRRCASGCRSPE